MTNYALKKEAFQRFKKRIKKFCEEHKEGEDIEYAGNTYDIDRCDFKEEKDEFAFWIEFDNPKVGLFEVRNTLKKGDLHLIQVDTRGHSRSELKGAWEALGIPITEEKVVCIEDEGTSYCPIDY